MSAVIGIVVGVAPAAFAWGTGASVLAYCYRTWFSDEVTFGGDFANYNVTGGDGFNLWGIAYLKRTNVTKDVVGWTKGNTRLAIRKHYSADPVIGDGNWHVDAYMYQYAPPNSSGQRTNTCIIT